MPFAHHACDHPASRLLPPPVRPRGPRAPWRHLLTGQGDPHTPPSEQPTGFVQHNKIENEFRESANASSWPPDRGPHRSRNVGQIAEPPRIWTATPQLRTGRHRPRRTGSPQPGRAPGRGSYGTRAGRDAHARPPPRHLRRDGCWHEICSMRRRRRGNGRLPTRGGGT
jgi:hypothetical protein